MHRPGYARRFLTEGSGPAARFALAIAGLLASPLMSGDLEAQGPQRNQPAEAFVPGEVLVLTSSDPNRRPAVATGANLTAPGGALRGTVVQAIALSARKRTQVLRVALPAGKSVREAVAEKWARTDPGVIAVEPNYIVHTAAVPDDSRFGDMWGLHNTGQTGGTVDADIDASEAWDIETGSPSVIVAVIDTGVEIEHPDLAANIWRNPGETGGGKEDNGIDDDGNGFTDDVYGYDFVDEDNVPGDLAGHGTHVAGTIGAAGNNSLGITGVNWQCRIMACRFMGARATGTVGDAIEAINYAVDNGARILSNSWATRSFSLALKEAIENARDHGVLFVAAAGNDSDDLDISPAWPASYDIANVIAVAATDHADGLASFSNFGATRVDVGAPGLGVLSTENALTTIFFENFEQAELPGFAGTQMVPEGSPNYWGTAQHDAIIPGNVAARADHAHVGNYLPGSDGSLVTPAFDTTSASGLLFDFQFQYEIGTTDLISVDVWDGAIWNTIFSLNTPEFLGTNFYWGGIREIPSEMRNAAMRIRFRWLTDATDNQYFGFELDNIRLQSTQGDHANAYGLRSGTSMATPHVSGVAALLLAREPGMSMNQLKQRLIWTGDPIPALEGKTLTGRRLNAYNALTAPARLEVVSPNLPVAWILGTTRTIRWASIGGAETVSIDLIRDGVPYSVVAAGAPNTGEFSWAIPEDLPEGAQYRIRVFDGVNTDESDEAFSLIRVFPILSEDFEGGLGDFVIDNTFGDGDGLWHLSSGRGSDPGHSPTQSLYYGQGETAAGGGNYDVGETAGAVLSPLINLVGVDPPLLLSFNYLIETEGFAPAWDNASIEVAELGGPFSPVAGNGRGTRIQDPSGTWLRAEVDASASAGKVIQLRLRFHTGDEFFNDFEGWYIDDIVIAGVPGEGPPAAISQALSVCSGSPTKISLQAFDDGQPDPPGRLEYLIASLPTNGALSTPDGTPIASVPFALPGNEVLYTPSAGHFGPDGFGFKANDTGLPPDGGDSNEATVELNVLEAEAPAPPSAPSPVNEQIRVAVNADLTWQTTEGAPLLFAATPALELAQLGTINRTSGMFVHIGPTPDARFDGLAFDRNSGTLYGVTTGGGGPGELFRLDPGTGALDFVGIISGTVFRRMSGLAFDPNTDTLYGVLAFASNSQLFRIDPTTAQVTAIGSAALATKITGLAFDPVSDTLYGTNHPFFGGAQLVTLDTVTGLHTLVGPLGAGINKADGLAYCADDGLLYTVDTDTGQLAFIDPATGAATLIGPTGKSWSLAYGLTCAVCPLGYDVFVDTESPPVQLVCEGASVPSCDPGILEGGKTYYWRVVVANCCGETEGPIWSFETACPTGPGDLDCDGDSDIFDFLLFSNCYNGASNPPVAQCQTSLADVDEDNDVDANDFMTFADCFNGSANPPRCP